MTLGLSILNRLFESKIIILPLPEKIASSKFIIYYNCHDRGVSWASEIGVQLRAKMRNLHELQVGKLET